MGQLQQPWDAQVVVGVFDVLGDTNTGLAASQIGQLLAELNIPAPWSATSNEFGFATPFCPSSKTTALPTA